MITELSSSTTNPEWCYLMGEVMSGKPTKLLLTSFFAVKLILVSSNSSFNKSGLFFFHCAKTHLSMFWIAIGFVLFLLFLLLFLFSLLMLTLTQKIDDLVLFLTLCSSLSTFFCLFINLTVNNSLVILYGTQ